MTTSASPKTATYKLQQANVLPQRAHAAAERDDKHEDADHQQHHGRVHGETRQRRLYGKRVDRGLEFFVLVHLVADRNDRFTCMLDDAGVHADSDHGHGDEL